MLSASTIVTVRWLQPDMYFTTEQQRHMVLQAVKDEKVAVSDRIASNATLTVLAHPGPEDSDLDASVRVYLAAMHGSDGLLDMKNKMVCKYAVCEDGQKDLYHEASLYCDQLKELQGLYVPRFIGLFEDPNSGNGKGRKRTLTTSLITVYVGEPPRVQYLKNLKDIDKHGFVDALVAVHKAGVRFGNLTMENIVVGAQDAIFLFNFEDARAHECDNASDIVLHTYQPPPEHHDCKELYLICYALGIWIPPSFKCYNRLIPGHMLEEPVAELVTKYAPKDVDRAIALKEAEMAIKDFMELHDEIAACDMTES